MNKKTLAKPFLMIGTFLTSLFGRVQWSSPPWFNSVKSKASRQPGLFYGALLGLLVVIGLGVAGYKWYQNQPKPRLVTASITAPELSTVEEDELVPDDLTIDFGYPGSSDDEFTTQSVAPLNMIGKTVPAGIEMSPAIAGEWTWETDSQLIFTPDEDWPAGQKYTIHFGAGVFADTAKMASNSWSFSTMPFEATLGNFKFHQDPTNPQNRELVATINFNFPVDPESLAEHTQLVLQEIKNDKQDLAARHFKFTINYDRFKRIAYLRSETIMLPEVPRYVRLTVTEGVKSAAGSAKTTKDLSENLLIPDAGSYFKINNATAAIIRNDQDRPEQLLNVETSLGVTDAELKKSLHVWLLPQNYPASANQAEQENYSWQNPGEVTAAILTLSTPLDLQALPTDRNYATLHSYKFSAKTPRFIYLKIDKGTRGFGDFKLANDYVAVISVPELPKEIGFLHKGALLALAGEPKLSVTIRGVPAVKFSIARVLPDSVNQLVTQTQGDFNNPYFINQSFNQQNISEIFAEIQQFDASDMSKLQYTALDLAKYVSRQTNTGGPQGLFLLQATGWDVEQNTPLDVKATRLILMTDLGIIVKDNNDGTHDVFVQSIAKGTPVPNVKVSILGKNGLPLLSPVTDEQGHVKFPVLSDFIEDREPTVYLATSGDDVSFIPYNNNNRQLNFSRFDVGGIYNYNQNQSSLSAYLFSDRGIYRPGDTVHIGMIVKQAFAQSQAAGLPLQVTITDPRGNTVLEKKFSLNEQGFESLTLETYATVPTGQYQVNLYIVKDNRADSLLGSTTVRVAEFQPDRMRIKATLTPASENGWVSPDNLQADVELMNLYGAPAADRTISAKVLLSPQRVAFDRYPDYVFVDPLTDPAKPVKVFTDNLDDIKTNAEGKAQFDLHLERFTKATYEMTFYAEGFEAEGGRSVAAQAKALVSPLPYFVGYKPDGDLAYIRQNSQRAVHFIAVNPQLNQIAVDNLKVQLLSMQPVTTLVKTENGTFQYQSIIKTTVINTQPFKLNEQGVDYTLPTDQIGDFALHIVDSNNTVISQFKFGVVGASQVSLAKNAELGIKLNKEEFNPGETIELQITAPYTGAGLITIERDKVYASQWFTTDTTSSVQKITIPADFQGNGYVNVAFVRNWDSPEIFISPLSYSVAPFTVNNQAHAMNIELTVSALARPGEVLPIEYKTDKPGKIVVFAVDEGILQVANYVTPDPLAFFFQKHALQVLTQQTVDQILPRYIQDRELSTVGGDDGEAMLANHLNPFKRKTDLPVVYWSGIIDTDDTPRQLTYTVPDYFNGTLMVMAVAVGANDVGAASTQAKIRGNFIISPNVPSFVAPGDEFEISVSIANNVKDSGSNASVVVNLNSPAELEVVGEREQTLTIAEGQEQTLRYKLRAKAELGSATLNFVANTAGKASSMDASLSIRPASSFMTTVTSGQSTDSSKPLQIDRLLYPQYRQVDFALSNNPLILVAGLQRYLDNFPYGCTEQLTSKALPVLSMMHQSWFNNDHQSISEKIASTVQMLSQRQMSNGGFSYWPSAGDNAGNDFATVYAMQFLTEARAAGFIVSNDLMYAGLNYLKEIAARNETVLDKARLQAYAIYVLTRNEIVTSNYLSNLQLNLSKDKTVDWQHDITSAYMASTYQLLKNQNEADKLITLYQVNGKAAVSSDFYDQNIADAQYLYLVARHFPNRLNAVSEKLILPLVTSMNSDEMNTVLAGYTSMALSAYAESQQYSPQTELSISETIAGKQVSNAKAITSAFTKLPVDDDVQQLTVNNPSQQTYFYQLMQSGFDKNPPAPMQNGIEISREYRDSEGNVITTIPLGKEVEVHIQLRSLDDRFVSNVAIVDLLPGGFEVVRDSVKQDKVDYADVREDRVVYFLTALPDAQELVYRIKATNVGTYLIPSILAESMYNPEVKAIGKAGQFSVTPMM